jgi:hypothetical protein
MAPKDILEVAFTVIASLGGGGAIVFGLSGYLGKTWADRALEKQKQQYAQLNIEFTNQLDVAKRRLQVELDALGHLRTLTTESEFQQLNALWKSFAVLETAFAMLPRAEMKFPYFTEEQNLNHSLKLTMKFSDSCNETTTVWRQEALSIPPHIEKAASTLLLIANDELAPAFAHPNAFVSSSFVSSAAQNEFFEQRSKRFSEFTKRMYELEELIRKYLLRTKPASELNSGSSA